jgi:hypothetical protein
MVKRKRFGRTTRSGDVHLLRRSLHCEYLEPRLLPGSMLLSLFGAGVGAMQTSRLTVRNDGQRCRSGNPARPRRT